MEDEIKFIDKEIQRLEDITKKTYYRLSYFRRVRKRLDEKGGVSIVPGKIEQLTMFGT